MYSQASLQVSSIPDTPTPSTIAISFFTVLEVVVSKLVVKEEDFRSDACTYGENGIYWSLKEVSENEIVLNGCGGEEYINPRPMINSNEKIEWFRSIIKS